MATTLKGIQANTESLSQQFDETKGVVNYELVRNYVVDSDTDYPSKADVLSTSGLPSIGSVIAIGNVLVRCVGNEVSELSKTCFLVSSTFTNNTKTSEDDDQVEDLPAEVTMGSTTIEISPAQDPQLGYPIRNSASEPLSTAQTVTLPTYQVVKYYRNFDIDVIRLFVNKTNSNVFFGAAANTTLCTDITANLIQKNDANNTYLWKVTFKFVFRFISPSELTGARHYQFRNNSADNDPAKTANYTEIVPAGWMVGRLNTGTKYKISSTSKDFIEFPAGEGPLNLDGTEWTPTSGKPIFLWYNQYEQADFNVLGIF